MNRNARVFLGRKGLEGGWGKWRIRNKILQLDSFLNLVLVPHYLQGQGLTNRSSPVILVDELNLLLPLMLLFSWSS